MTPIGKPATVARTWLPRIRVLAGLTVLAVLVWRLGVGPFMNGLEAISAPTILLAVAIGLLTTVCSAWRWTLVAGGLGIGLPTGEAVKACYRSQFLNTMLPGGVLGDVHRGVRHGRDTADLSRGLRAVAAERVAGQMVFFAMTVVVLVLLPSPVQSWVPLVVVLLVGAVAIGWVLTRLTQGQQGWWGRTIRLASADIREGLTARSVWPGVVFASAVVAAGHTATFLIAVGATGTTATLTQLLPVAGLVLLAMVLPLNIGGWGPREGMAAWAFAATGLGASQGVAAATLYGVLALVATLPGAAVLIAGIFRHQAPACRRASWPRPDVNRKAAANG